MKKLLLTFLIAIFCFACNKQEQATQLSIDGDKNYSLGNVAVNLTVKVNCNTSWTYAFSENVDWIVQKNITASSVDFQISANPSQSERKVEVVFYSPNKDNPVVTDKVSISQKGAAFEPELILTPADVAVDAEPHEATISVQTNISEWEFELGSECDWLTATKKSGAIDINITKNSSEDSRSVSGTVYAPSKEKCQIAKYFKVLQDGAIIEYDPVNLSEAGTANCYMILHRGEYSFDATKCGNGKTVSGLSEPKTLSPEGVKLLWQSSPGIVQSLSLKDGVITFFANRVFGNFLIAATDAEDTVLWSWHIWFPKEAPVEMKTVSGYKIMQYNLGAIDSQAGMLSSYGLLYQWGRKDPFPGSPKASGGDVTIKNVDVYDINGKKYEIGSTKQSTTIEESIKNPTLCNGNAAQYTDSRDWLVKGQSNNSLWGNPDGWKYEDSKYKNVGSKTYFDPCPLGWRVPPIKVFVDFTETGGMVWASGDTSDLKWSNLGGATKTSVVDLNYDGKYSIDDDWKNGWHFWLDKSKTTMSYFPATTRYDGQYALLMGSMVGLWANYWYNAPDKDQGMAYAFAFGIKDYTQKWSVSIGTNSCGSKADAYAIRCIKDE